MSINHMVSHEINMGGQTISFKTGDKAFQATGCVTVQVGDTVVMATLVACPKSSPADFLPLMVDYREPVHSAGRIPGGYIKREGRPSERETLVSRLIDRSIRPLFPKDFRDEVQVLTKVLSLDPQLDPVIPAMLSVAAVLRTAGMPIDQTIGMAHVAHTKDQQLVVNPSNEQKLECDDLDLMVAASKEAILMVESSANELSDQQMLDALNFAKEEIQQVVEGIDAFVAKTSVTPYIYQQSEHVEIDSSITSILEQQASSYCPEVFNVSEKKERKLAISKAREQALEKALVGQDAESINLGDLTNWLANFEKNYYRTSILEGNQRMDGRDHQTVRPIQVETSALPRSHGSALFQRGETQALATVTLGGGKDAQSLDGIYGEEKQPFMLHYNFPAYSVGEVGFAMGPKRREIGHGRLAWRALQAVMPDLVNQFPYVIRAVSDILSCNGSSSMATVCATSLALMDAGVPLKAPVAGIAMGLIKQGDKYRVLTDILGDEDHVGDMDFKVAGTSKGITALQMDIKVSGISDAILTEALTAANKARMTILETMNQNLPQARAEISQYAPQFETLKIKTSRIKDVIGKGGATIREIIDKFGVEIDISDDGLVKIQAFEKSALQKAKAHIEVLTKEIEVDEIFRGKVMRVIDAGAFVSLVPGKDGFLHISQITHERVNNIHDYIKEGDEVTVRVIELDRQGRIRVTKKDVPQT
ncbi:polyribonucleotide nucleotidyltransferase [Gammaproteobacteria bacterium]|nr:polyribonucleotide nucleotidyltransferase [Gammaproteobacteria bacterium]